MKKVLLCIIIPFLMLQAQGQLPQEIEHIIEVSKKVQLHKPDETEINVTKAEQEITNEYRRLYFIHGLGGNGSSWTKVPEACTNLNLNINNFSPRKCYTYTPDYSNYTMGSLYYVAESMTINELRMVNYYDKINNIDPSKAILIGHSQGGLVCRTMINYSLNNPEAAHGPDFGGFISVASPLGGAQILNNRDDILLMANNACTKILPAYTTKVWLINGIFKFLTGNDYLNNALTSGCDFVTQDMLPIFFLKYYDEVTNNYLVGAPWINTLKQDINDSRYRNMPKITFYCVEPRDRIFWRTLEWLQKNPNSAAYFEANSDLSFYENNIHSIYQDFYNQLQISRQKLEWLEKNKWWLSWAYYYYELNKYTNYAEGYGKGVEWFNEVDREWEVIIGALTYESSTLTSYICDRCTDSIPNAYYISKRCFPWENECHYIGLSIDYDACVEAGCDNILIQSTGTVYTPIIKESDGVVTAESAIDLPYMTNEPIRVYPREYENVIDKGSSHMQIRNDEGIKEHLNNAFNGYYGRFFYTEPK